MSMRSSSFLSLGPHEFHRVAYYEWGDPSSEHVTVCVHGLTRNARDFDPLAARLSGERRVVCPDVVGRGQSDWLPVKTDYGYPTYCADMSALLARLDAGSVDWVGTSMGGIIGMLLAAMPNSPIRRLVINDIGPFIPKAALARIRDYTGTDPRFASFDEATGYLRQIHAPFGPLTDDQWRHLAEHSTRQDEEGQWRLSYDPGIVAPMRAQEPEDIDLWGVWEAIRCPVLVLHGAESDVLLPQTAQAMKERGPTAEVVTLEGIGHAPALMEEGQIGAIAEWLDSRGQIS